MAAPASTGLADASLPRPLAIAVYPLVFIVLTGFFIFLGFPYDLLATRITTAVEAATPIKLRIGELSPHIGLLGPGLAASDVLAGQEGSRTIALESLVLRPAWSLSWFRLIPAVHLDAESEIGSADGTIELGGAGAWDGTLTDVQLGSLPLGELTSAVDLQGTLNAEIDLRGGDAAAGETLVGSIEFEVADGTLSTDGMPLALPFDRLAGRLTFGDEVFLRVSDVVLEGPMLAASAAGEVGQASRQGAQSLDLKIQYELKDESLASMLGARGRRGADGRSQLVVAGTVANPIIR